MKLKHVLFLMCGIFLWQSLRNGMVLVVALWSDPGGAAPKTAARMWPGNVENGWDHWDLRRSHQAPKMPVTGFFPIFL